MIIEKCFEEKYPEGVLHDYLNVEQHELTVTITLAEYRSLLLSKYKLENNQEKLNWFEQYNRANKAEAQVKELEAALSAMSRVCPSAANKSEGEADNA